MLTFTFEQYERLNKAFADYRRRQLVSRLRRDGDIPHNISDKEAVAVVDQTIAEGTAIDIIDDEDVVRLARLVFARQAGSINQKQAERIGNTLSNVSTSADDRLSFIERHVWQRQ